MASKFTHWGIILILSPLSSFAQLTPCTPSYIFPKKTLPQNTQHMEAWGIQLHATSELIQLKGETELLDTRLWLRADQLKWSRHTQHFQAQGHIQAQTPQWLLEADRLDYQRPNERFSAEQTTFQSISAKQRGTASQLVHEELDKTTHMQQTKLTSCPLGNDDWYLHAKNIRIDQTTQRVYIYHGWLDFKGVPIFYTPYISYPLTERASGWLMPSFSQHQSPNRDSPSWLFGLPYYFNLAPNYDDTLTFYQFQDRGTLLDNAFRSLNRWQRSTLNTSFLNDEVTGQTRWRIKLNGQQTWHPTLRSDILWQKISDRDFYADIPLDTRLKTASYAKRHARLNWQPSKNFSAYLLHQDYLLLDNAVSNYEKRPEVGIQWQHSLTPALSTQLNWQVTEFEIPTADHNKPEGLRSVASPKLEGNWVEPWGDYGMTLQLQNNRYQLRNSTETESIFSVPMAAIHGRLIFERPASEWGIGWVQTLEPKLQYTYIPLEEEQLNAPNFDSGLRTLNFNNLFALNRFSGLDRIGDTQRLSVSLTTRLLNAKGKERARLAAGQAFYLAPRQITLTNLQEDTTPRSNYFVQLQAQTNWLWLDNTLEIQQDTTFITNLISRLRLNFRALTWKSQYNWQNINQSTEKQTLLAGLTIRLPSRWEINSFSNYDFISNQRIQNIHALSYESCCWKGELQVDESQTVSGKYSYSISLVFTFKGLSTVGETFSQQVDKKLKF